MITTGSRYPAPGCEGEAAQPATILYWRSLRVSGNSTRDPFKKRGRLSNIFEEMG